MEFGLVWFGLGLMKGDGDAGYGIAKTFCRGWGEEGCLQVSLGKILGVQISDAAFIEKSWYLQLSHGWVCRWASERSTIEKVAKC